MTLWPLGEFAQAVWWSLFNFGRAHPVLAVAMALALVGVVAVLVVDRE